MIRRDRSPGFTLIEALVMLAVMSIALLLVAPPLHNMIRSAKLEGVTRETAQLIHLARLEAVKQSVQAVVWVDGASGEVIAFADVDGATAGDPPDGLFNPVEGAPPRWTDYLIGRTSIPSGISQAAPAGQGSVDGLTPIDSNRVVLLLSDGSVDEIGAYRFGDWRDNFLEVRVEPRATARVTVAKWDEDSGRWWSRGEGARAWHWN
jgi:type II secretory pathway pseudopilin PulG